MKSKILFVTPSLAVPPNSGLTMRNYYFLKFLSEKYCVTAMTYDKLNKGSLNDWMRESGIASASLGEYPFAQESERQVFMKSLLAFIPGGFSRFNPKKIAKKIKKWITSEPGEKAVILDTQILAQAALFLGNPGCPIIGSFVDVYANYRKQAFQQIAGLNLYKVRKWIEWLKVAAYEKKIISSISLGICVSHENMRNLNEKKRKPFIVFPNGVDTEFFRRRSRIKKSNIILYVGNFNYPPNVDGFFNFIENILPAVAEQIPQAKFRVVGFNPTPKMLSAAASDPRIEIIGNAEDLRPYYETAEIAVIPLRIGSGTKLKLFEAMSMEMPIVTTSIGAEGVNGLSKNEVLIADHPVEFAGKVCHLFKSPEAAFCLGQNARRFSEYYDWQTLFRDFEIKLDLFLKNP